VRPTSGVLGREKEMEKEKEITTGADRLELKDNRRGHGGAKRDVAVVGFVISLCAS
jgi:hypothetical protein